MKLVFQYQDGYKAPMEAGSVWVFDADQSETFGHIGVIAWYREGYGRVCRRTQRGAVRTYWVDRSYQISDIKVDPDYRRRGIATRLLTEAHKYAPVVQSMIRSIPGDAWAKSTGEFLPECPCGDPHAPHRSPGEDLRRRQEEARRIGRIS